MNAPLYDTALLRLAATIPHHRRLDQPDVTVERRTPICGSRIVLDMTLDPAGRVAEIGLEVSACALGQASAHLFAAHAVERSPQELADARDALAAWLDGISDIPGSWPGLDALARARPHRGRHAAILLPFEAAAQAAAEAQR